MISRRKFLSLTAGVTAAALVASCVSQEAGGPALKEVIIPPADVPEPGNEPLRSRPGRFFLINNDDGLLALSTVCTHQGCNVNWENGHDRFHCPCHGSIYNRHGEKTDGPAPRPLDLMTITVNEDDSVLVTTAPIIRRKEWEPDQSTPYT